MSLTQDLNEQISKHLPGLVGDELKRRLEQADADAANAKRLPEITAQRDEARKKFEVNESKYADLASRETALLKREQDITLREKLIVLREDHADERVKEMRGVVADVFANNRFKYTENYSHSGFAPSGGSSNHSGMRTVDQTS